MIEEQLARANLLLVQGRHDLALEHYRAALALDPELPLVHYGLAHCLLATGDLDGAKQHAEILLGLDPEYDMAHWILGRVALRSHKPRQAREHANAMRGLDPDQPLAEALLAETHLHDKQWQKAIDAAERGLALEADHDLCLNIRSHALAQLGRHGEAADDIQESLRRDADDPHTHANAGWNYLRSGDHRQARTHFSESLRLEPDNEWARSGLIESIKSSNSIYRSLFRLLQWLGSLPTGKFFFIMIATIIGRRMLLQSAEGNPGLEIIANVVIFTIFGLFVILNILVPLGNVAILAHPLGRYALSSRERLQASLLACAILASVGTIGGLLVLYPSEFGLGFGMMACLWFYSLVLATIPDRLVLWSRAILVMLGIAFSASAVLYVVSIAIGRADIALALFSFSILGLVALTWISGLLVRFAPE